MAARKLKVVEDVSPQIEIIKSLQTDHLQCRTMGHTWQLIYWGPVDLLEEAGIEVKWPTTMLRWRKVRVSVCTRCETVRDEFYPKDTIDPMDTWRVSERRYRYAFGYTVRGGTHIDRRLYTREAYQRISGHPE